MRIPQPVENELTSVLLHLSLLKALQPRSVRSGSGADLSRSPDRGRGSSPSRHLACARVRGPERRAFFRPGCNTTPVDALHAAQPRRMEHRIGLMVCSLEEGLLSSVRVSSWRLAAPLWMRTPPQARCQPRHAPDPAGGSGSPTSCSARWL